MRSPCCCRYFKGRSLAGTSYSIILSAASLLAFYLTSSWGIVFNTVFMFLAGVFNCGPDSILGESSSPFYCDMGSITFGDLFF